MCHLTSGVTGTKNTTVCFTGGNNNAFDAIWYWGQNSTCSDISSCPTQAWREGKIWILYQYLLPQYRVQIQDPGSSLPRNATPIPDSAWERHQLLCQSYNASFNIQRTYTDFQETIQGVLQYLNPLNYSADVFTGATNYDMNPEYAGFAIHQVLYTILSGSIQPN